MSAEYQIPGADGLTASFVIQTSSYQYQLPTVQYVIETVSVVGPANTTQYFLVM